MSYTVSENLGLRFTEPGSTDGDWAANFEFNLRRLEECFTKPIPHTPEDISGAGMPITVVQSRYVRKGYEITWYFRMSFGSVVNGGYSATPSLIKLPFPASDYATAKLRIEAGEVLALIGPGDTGMGLLGYNNAALTGKLLIGSITYTTAVDPHIAV